VSQQPSKENPFVFSDTTVRYLLAVNVDFAMEEFEGSVATLLGLTNPGLAETFQCHVFWKSTTRTTCTSILAVTSIVIVIVPDATIVAVAVAVAVVHIVAYILIGMLITSHTHTSTTTTTSCKNTFVVRKLGLKNASKVAFSELLED
jgi:hypothetical protein